jgi:hypothetical protein
VRWFADVCGLCPLTAETEKLIDADALGRVKPSAYLLNAARGRVVDETALVDALARRQTTSAARIAASFLVSAMAVPLPQRRVARLIARETAGRV